MIVGVTTKQYKLRVNLEKDETMSQISEKSEESEKKKNCVTKYTLPSFRNAKNNVMFVSNCRRQTAKVCLFRPN